MFSCRQRAGKPEPYVKLTSLQTVLSHSWCVSFTAATISFACQVGASSPQPGFRYGVIRFRTPRNELSLKKEKPGTTGKSETAFETTVVTCGTRPAARDIAKLVDPWQWMTAFTLSAPVVATIFSTAFGWS